MLSVGDAEISRPLDFQRAMLDHRAGEQLRLAVRRDGNPLELKLTLGGPTRQVKSADQPAWDLLGVELKAISPAEFRQTPPDPLPRRTAGHVGPAQ